MRFLSWVEKVLCSAETLFIGSALAFTSLLLFVNVVLRYVFLHPIFWAEELTLYLIVWVVFIGGSVIVRTRGHIAVDVLPVFLSGRGNRLLKIAVAAVSIVFCLSLFFYSGQHTLRIQSSGQVMPAMQAPMWLAYLAIPVGSILMALRMFQAFIGLLTRQEVGEKVKIDLSD